MQRRDHLISTGHDTKLCRPHTANFFSARMDMNQRFSVCHQGIALRFDVAQPTTKRDDQISFFEARCQLGVQAHVQITGIRKALIVDVILPAKPCGHGNVVSLGKLTQTLCRVCGPMRATHNNKRTLRTFDPLHDCFRGFC